MWYENLFRVFYFLKCFVFYFLPTGRYGHLFIYFIYTFRRFMTWQNGRIQDFFGKGCTTKEWRNSTGDRTETPVVLESRRSSRSGGWWCAPLHPPPWSASAKSLIPYSWQGAVALNIVYEGFFVGLIDKYVNKASAIKDVPSSRLERKNLTLFMT